MMERRAGFALALAFVSAACDQVPLGAPGVERVTAAATVGDVDSVLSADSSRSGFYPNQPMLDPGTVGSPYFGQLFDSPLDGAVYAQPLCANGVVLVATETNHVYGLDAATGATLWAQALGTPFQAADLNCPDLAPSIGVTGTPAIDLDTGTAYLVSKTYVNGASGPAAFYAHALDLSTGAERDGFPILIAGAASNDSSHVFSAERQHQRPGLLLMDGVVYAAFGAHCDAQPYAGYVVGISTKGYIQTMWSTEAGANLSGGGIWQSGGGLVSDGDGQIIFATGNDWSTLPGPIAGQHPPATLGEAIVRLTVQPDGTLSATDFFSPANRDTLNRIDGDLGAGAPIALPASFGTTAHPNLLAQVGKFGSFYLLDRDDFGGYEQGPNGGDRSLQTLGPAGAAWSKPSVWPGDGGWVYVPVVNNCTADQSSGCLVGLQMSATGDGTPVLAPSATSSSSFGYGTSAVVVTADGTRSGSALLWTIWSSGTLGTGGELRAYDALPQSGTFTLRYLAGIGTSSKFTAPAVGDGRIYVGNRDGHLLGFGVTGAPTLRAQGAAFAPTLVGDDAQSAVQVTASGSATIMGVGISGDFSLSADAPAVPFTVAAGASFSLPVVFHPSMVGAIVGTLRITTDTGSFAIPLSGVGQSAAPMLTMSPPVLTFAPVVMGNVATETVTVTNVSDAPMTLTGVTPPAAPFSVMGLPDPGAVLDAGDSLTATITYAPTMVGTSSGYLSIMAGDAVAAMAVEGSALMGGKLRIAPLAIDQGSDYVGNVSMAVFQLSNDGDAPVTIEKSKPPTTSAFEAIEPFPEGTILAPGGSIEQLVRVSPTVVGANTDLWQINADDGQGLRLVTFTATGLAQPPPAPAPSASVASTTTPLTDSRGASGPPATAAGGCRVAGPTPAGSSCAAALAALALAVARRRRCR